MRFTMRKDEHPRDPQENMALLLLGGSDRTCFSFCNLRSFGGTKICVLVVGISLNNTILQRDKECPNFGIERLVASIVSSPASKHSNLGPQPLASNKLLAVRHWPEARLRVGARHCQLEP